MTATGLPFLVTVTRSWVPTTSSITWLKRVLTHARDCVVMTTSGHEAALGQAAPAMSGSPCEGPPPRGPRQRSRWAETGALVIADRRSGEHRGDPLSPRGPTDATGALMVVISP